MVVAIAGPHGKIRPGRLTGDPGTPRANHRVLYVNGGEDPLEDALTHVLAAG